MASEGSFDIIVSDPVKSGEGLNSYIRYKIVTRTNLPGFPNRESIVTRRYNEFLTLFDYLTAIYKPKGVVIVKPPQKSIKAMAKAKSTTDVDVSELAEVMERQVRFQIFLNRIASHPKTRDDPEFHAFLYDQEWPQKIRFQKTKGPLSRIAERVNKRFIGSVNQNDFDEWFVLNYQKYTSIQPALAVLEKSASDILKSKNEISQQLMLFSSTCTNLCFSEIHSGLANVFSKLSNLREEEGRLEQRLSKEYLVNILAEIKDQHMWVLGLISVFKNAVLLKNELTELTNRLEIKREDLRYKELMSTPRKITLQKQDIFELENSSTTCKDDLEKVLANLKEEVDYFDTNRIKTIKNCVLNFLRAQLDFEIKMKKSFEKFLPVCQMIDQTD